MPRPYESDGKGLSGLAEAVLGLPLDKRDQMSDWDKRPLTKEQVSVLATPTRPKSLACI